MTKFTLSLSILAGLTSIASAQAAVYKKEVCTLEVTRKTKSEPHGVVIKTDPEVCNSEIASQAMKSKIDELTRQGFAIKGSTATTLKETQTHGSGWTGTYETTTSLVMQFEYNHQQDFSEFTPEERALLREKLQINKVAQ